MDNSKSVESVLNALLLNVAELQKSPSPATSNEQSRLLDSLLTLWNRLTDDEKNNLLSNNLEQTVQKLAQENATCLRKVHPHRTHCASSKKLEFIRS